mmetsp:Transcript_15446/g.35560  ORF Transcript_15446/g.35560 Transcript_15446/m.35560 type:complete len:353 (+) Transcript_15446:58-1116(+)
MAPPAENTVDQTTNEGTSNVSVRPAYSTRYSDYGVGPYTGDVSGYRTAAGYSSLYAGGYSGRYSGTYAPQSYGGDSYYRGSGRDSTDGYYTRPEGYTTAYTRSAVQQQPEKTIYTSAERRMATIRVPKVDYDIKEIEVPRKVEVPRQIMEEVMVPKEVPREIVETIMVPKQITKTVMETVMVPEQRARTVMETQTVMEKQSIKVPKPVIETKTYHVQRPRMVMETVPVTVQEPAYEEQTIVVDDALPRAAYSQGYTQGGYYTGVTGYGYNTYGATYHNGYGGYQGSRYSSGYGTYGGMYGSTYGTLGGFRDADYVTPRGTHSGFVHTPGSGGAVAAGEGDDALMNKFRADYK